MPGNRVRCHRGTGDQAEKKNTKPNSGNEIEPDEFKYVVEDNHEPSLKMMGCTFDEQIEWSKFSLPVKSDLHDLIQYRISNFVNPNITIKIGTKEFGCHLLVLQCYSSFFERLDKYVKSAELPEGQVTCRAFQTVYNWMIYPDNGCIQLLTRNNVLEIFMAAQFLKVKELEEQCWAFIDNEDLFCEDTAFLLYLDARRLQNSVVMELMVPRIQRFFLILVSSMDWLQLDVEEVCIFLKSNYICIHCEMEVFMSGVRWLMWDWSSRHTHLLQVMRCVRFGLIAPWQLVDIRRNPESAEFLEVTAHAEVSKMIDDGMAFAIIKHSHGQESHNESHWIELLGLSVPAERNWAGNGKKYLVYKDFLDELELYRSQPVRSSYNPNLQSPKMTVEESSTSSCETIAINDVINKPPTLTAKSKLHYHPPMIQNPVSLKIPPFMPTVENMIHHDKQELRETAPIKDVRKHS